MLLLALVAAVAVIISSLFAKQPQTETQTPPTIAETLPSYTQELYAVVRDNEPDFTPEQLLAEPYEFYSELDGLGRCGYAMACLSEELMPDEERTGIGHVRPSGWETIKYDFIDGKYLYNRCHLIGFQLAGENANEKNLITGTRSFNVSGMLPFENMVADYIQETGNKVLYRVTPVYEGDNLVASGVLMEAKSVEDDGEGICFCVYVYNVEPGVIIDYATGSSCVDEEYFKASGTEEYVLNTNSKRFHKVDCGDISNIRPENREVVNESRGILIADGYKPCGKCDP